MHRTTTTAMLLVTVAVSALTGCVTVEGPLAPDPPPAPSKPSAPRPDGSSSPRVVQAPAREALGMVPPSADSSPAADALDRDHAPLTDPGAEPRAGAHPPEALPPEQPRSWPHVAVPPTVSGRVPRNADVCALGRRYGGWRPDSPAAVICGRVYRR